MEIILSLNGTLAPYLSKDILNPKALVVAVDGGLSHLELLNIKPDFILGDFDSTSHLNDKRYVHLPNQDLTDFQKSLKYLFNRYDDISQVTIIGAIGGRFDHTLNNLNIIGEIHPLVKVILYGENETIYRVMPFVDFKHKLPLGTTLSLLPLGVVTGLVTTGLKWDLLGDNLGIDEGISQSNKTIEENIEIETDGGVLFVSVLKNDAPV